MIYNQDLFGANLLNFAYDVFDISNDDRFTKDKLVAIKNVTSAIFLLDQKMDALEFLHRIKVIALYFNSLSDTEIKAIKNWIKNTVVEELADPAIKILEADKWEVELMVARNAFILDEMKEKSKLEGKEEGKAELLLKQLNRRFKLIPEAYAEKIANLPESKIEQIGLDIFELENINDLEKYFIK